MFRALIGKLITWIIIALILVGPIIYVLTAAGMISLPLVGGFIYSTPVPNHVVESGTPLDAAALAKLTLSESALTASMQAGLAASGGDQTFIPAKSQVAVIEGQGLEIFLPFIGNKQDSALTIDFNLNLEEGKLTPNVQSFKIGQLPVAPVIVKTVLEKTIQTALDTFNTQLASFITIESVEYGNGAVVLSGSLTNGQ